jgi:hypothetical protein
MDDGRSLYAEACRLCGAAVGWLHNVLDVAAVLCLSRALCGVWIGGWLPWAVAALVCDLVGRWLPWGATLRVLSIEEDD